MVCATEVYPALCCSYPDLPEVYPALFVVTLVCVTEIYPALVVNLAYRNSTLHFLLVTPIYLKSTLHLYVPWSWCLTWVRTSWAGEMLVRKTALPTRQTVYNNNIQGVH